jgi:hypothetical protein
MFGPVPGPGIAPHKAYEEFFGGLIVIFGVQALFSKGTVNIFGRSIQKSAVGLVSLIVVGCIAAWILH